MTRPIFPLVLVSLLLSFSFANSLHGFSVTRVPDEEFAKGLKKIEAAARKQKWSRVKRRLDKLLIEQRETPDAFANKRTLLDLIKRSAFHSKFPEPKTKISSMEN